MTSDVTAIKKKLTNLSETIRKNLIEHSSDVTRKFIINEDDFLSILTLAIRFLHKKDEKTEKADNNSPISTQPTTEPNMKPAEGGGHHPIKRNNLCPDVTQTTEAKRLRNELLRVLSDNMFSEDAKTELLVDVFRRYENRVRIAKQQHLENQFRTSHPNVMVGGGGKETPSGKSSDTEEIGGEDETPIMEKNSDITQQQTRKNNEENSKKAPGPPAISKSGNHLWLPRTWLDNAVEIIKNFMKNRINIIFLNNVKHHANKLSIFFEKKGIVDEKNRSIFSPNKLFYIKNHFLYFNDPQNRAKNLSFDLAKLLVTISFTKNKIFKFIKYREKEVNKFSEKEKKFLGIFLRKFPINRHRIPCKIVRDFR